MKIEAEYKVNGEPILGTYTASSIEDVGLAKDLGMNTVIGGREMLDTDTEVGGYIRDNGIWVLYHLTKFIYGLPRLGARISPDQTEIPLIHLKRDIPDRGLIRIEDELIAYGGVTGGSLLECERGAEGTDPAPHREGIFLFYPREFEAEIESVRGSPNLLGYYVLDDSPGDVISSLRAMYEIIGDVERDERHMVCAGYGSPGSLCNFGPGICDLMLIYWYPVNEDAYDRYLISRQVQWMLTTARSRVPGIPFVGVYQAFWGNGAKEPTPAQVREQAEDFIREGASGLIAFACRVGASYGGWSDSPPVQAELRRIHREIRDGGGLELPPQPERMMEERVQPTGYWERPREIPGLVPAWHVIGPFDDPERNSLGTIHPPENRIDLESIHDGKYGPVRWIERETQAGWVGLGEIYGAQDITSDSIAYATCSVEVDTEREAVIGLGSDDDIELWMNGESIFSHEGTRGVRRDDDLVPVIIPSGQNRLLVKVCNRKGMWGFFLRFKGPDGEPMTGLRFYTG